MAVGVGILFDCLPPRDQHAHHTPPLQLPLSNPALVQRTTGKALSWCLSAPNPHLALRSGGTLPCCPTIHPGLPLAAGSHPTGSINWYLPFGTLASEFDHVTFSRSTDSSLIGKYGIRILPFLGCTWTIRWPSPLLKLSGQYALRRVKTSQ